MCRNGWLSIRIYPMVSISLVMSSFRYLITDEQFLQSSEKRKIPSIFEVKTTHFVAHSFFKRKAILKNLSIRNLCKSNRSFWNEIILFFFFLFFFSFWINSLFWNNIRESMRISFNEIFGISVKMRFFAKCHKTLT